MRFEVSVNGKRVCVAGQDGFGVLTALLSWRKNDPEKLRPEERENLSDAWEQGALDFSVGGIDGKDDRHTSWQVPNVVPGDLIGIRVLAEGDFDPPAAKFPKQEE